MLKPQWLHTIVQCGQDGSSAWNSHSGTQVPFVVNITTVNTWPPKSQQKGREHKELYWRFYRWDWKWFISLPICFCSHLGFKPQIDCFSRLFICLLNPFSGLLYSVSWKAGLWKLNNLSFLAFCLLVGFREWEVPARECKQEEKEVEVSFTSLPLTLSQWLHFPTATASLVGTPCFMVPALAILQKHCSLNAGCLNSFLQLIVPGCFSIPHGVPNCAHFSVNCLFLGLYLVKSLDYTICFPLKHWHTD